VDRTLRRAYSILRHPLPWQWSTVYDDLPLLQRYRKLGVFFWAFWLWPVLLFAPPLLVSIAAKFPSTAFQVPAGPLRMPFVSVVVYGTGVEIYLIHQIVIALLAGRGGPPLRVPAWFAGPWKSGIAAALAVGTILTVRVVSDSGCTSTYGPGTGATTTATPCEIWIRPLVWLLPLLLLPLFMLAHDLEAEVRYLAGARRWPLRLGAVVLRRTTDLLYIVTLIPALTQAYFSQATDFPIAWATIYFAFMIYLFAVPLLTVLGLRLITRRLAR
jgi:hypothetical protein